MERGGASGHMTHTGPSLSRGGAGCCCWLPRQPADCEGVSSKASGTLHCMLLHGRGGRKPGAYYVYCLEKVLYYSCVVVSQVLLQGCLALSEGGVSKLLDTNMN